MNYITRVESNVKGGCDVALGARTLIIGPNGSGKSAIVNAIELAIRGRVSDLIGRADVGVARDLIALGPSRLEPFARVRFVDGGEASWLIPQGGKLAKHFPNDAARMPLFDVREAVLGSDATQRQFFTRLAVGALTTKDVLDRLPTTLGELYTRVATQGVTEVDRLLGAITEAGKRARTAKAEAAALMAGVSANAAGSQPTEAEVAAAREAVRKAREWQDKLRAQNTRASTIERVQAARERVAKAQSVCTEIRAAAGDTVFDPVLFQARDVLYAMTERGTRGCLTCGCVEQSSDAYATRLADVDRYLASVKRTHDRLREATRELELAQQALGFIAPAGDGVAIYAAADPAALIDAERDVGVAEAALRSVDQRANDWSRVRSARDQSDVLTKRADEYARLGKELSTIVRDVLESRVETFSKRVQLFLPAADKFLFRLDGNSVDFGLVHADVLHTALSGAEWARVQLAMAAASIVDDSGVNVLIPEDRAWDPATLAACLRAWSNIPGQVIVATTTDPAQPIPAEWTIVRVGGAV